MVHQRRIKQEITTLLADAKNHLESRRDELDLPFLLPADVDTALIPVMEVGFPN